MLLKDFISGSVRGLEPLYGREEAKSLVLMLCEACLGTKSYTHIVNPEYSIDISRQAELDAAMKRLETGEPVQYVLGYADFAGYRFRVTPSVLIPRPETEQLFRIAGESVARRLRMKSAFGRSGVKVLDLCTGSGCLAWSLALSYPAARVLAADISQEALDVASGQNFKSEMKKTGAVRPEFTRADVLDTDAAGLTEPMARWGGFDVLVSNPPYVRDSEKSLMRKNVCDFEPGIALFVPDEDPLVFYRAIALWAGKALVDGGAGFVEINEAFGPETRQVFREEGFTDAELVKDFCGKNRFVRFTK